MPRIIESGGGGGGGAVLTDGTSIAGDGTNLDRIREVPVDCFISIGREDATSAAPANKVQLSGFILTSAQIISNIWIDFRSGGNVLFSFGIYDALGNLVADTGPITIGSAAIQPFPILTPATVLQPGRYLLGATSIGGAATWTKSTAQLTWFYDDGSEDSALGQLPATITPPAIALSLTSLNFGLS